MIIQRMQLLAYPVNCERVCTIKLAIMGENQSLGVSDHVRHKSAIDINHQIKQKYCSIKKFVII